MLDGWLITNPGGVWAFAAVPLVILAHLVRARPPRRVVPAAFLFEGVASKRRAGWLGRPRLEWPIVIQFLLLLLLAAAILRPEMRTLSGRAALVLDATASLQAAAGGRSRFDEARAAALDLVAGRGEGTWDLWILAPEPRLLATGATAEDVRRRLRLLVPSDAPDPPDALLERFLAHLAADGHEAVHVFTDRPADDARGLATIHAFGGATENRAITALRVFPVGRGGRVPIEIEVSNFGDEEWTSAVELRTADGARQLAREPVAVPALGTALVRTEIDATAFRARIDGGDALVADDEAFGPPPPAITGRLLFVAAEPDAAFAEAAGALGLEVEHLHPVDYVDARGDEATVVVFRGVAPAREPNAPVLHLVPPPAPFLPVPLRRIDVPVLGLASEAHPVLRYVDAATLELGRALLLDLSEPWHPLVIAPGGVVVAAREAPTRAIVSGADLFPFRGGDALPRSVLTLNALGWLATGEFLVPLATGVPLREADAALRVRRPDGAWIEDARERPATPLRGFYEIVSGAESRIEARSLLSASESDLRSARPFPRGAARGADPTPGVDSFPVAPWILVAAGALLLLEAAIAESRSATAARTSLRLVRLGALGAMILAWLDPQTVSTAPTAPAAVLVDVSRSLSPESVAATRAAIRESPFAGVPVLFFAETLGRTSELADDALATDLEAVLSAAAATLPANAPVVVATDGWETRGEALAAAPTLATRGNPLWILPIEQPGIEDLDLRDLSLPAAAAPGEPIRAALRVRHDGATAIDATIVLREADRVLVEEPARLVPGENLIALALLAPTPGLHAIEAELRGAGTAVERTRAWISVAEEPGVLLLGRDPSAVRYLESALASRGIRVDRRTGDPLAELPELSRFRAVILDDLPARALPKAAAVRLRDWVRDGGALVMVGGPSSFGLGDWKGTAVEEALPVAMKPRQREEPRSSIVLVMDKSGSMEQQDRIAFARASAIQLSRLLAAKDRLAVVAFDHEAFLVTSLGDVEAVRDPLERELLRLKASGGTRLYPALEEARRQLASETERRRHVIVFSDGLSENTETEAGREEYYRLVRELAADGITVSTIALGKQADATFLEAVARNGGGAFHVTDEAAKLPELVLGDYREQARERTLREETIPVVPSKDSPLVDEIARAAPSWPAVLGLVETTLKPGARLDVGAAVAEAPPVVASWSFGRGRAAAVTTDSGSRWSDPWVRWPHWSPLWGGIVRALAPAHEARRESFRIARDGEDLVVEYVRYDRDPADTPIVELGDGTSARMVRIVEGRYRARLPKPAVGDHRVVVREGTRPLTDPPLGVTIASADPVERPRAAANRRGLAALAAATGGVLLDRLEPPAEAPRTEKREPLAPFVLAAAITLLLLEWVLRRRLSETPSRRTTPGTAPAGARA